MEKNAMIYVDYGTGDSRHFINILKAHQDLEKICLWDLCSFTHLPKLIQLVHFTDFLNPHSILN